MDYYYYCYCYYHGCLVVVVSGLVLLGWSVVCRIGQWSIPKPNRWISYLDSSPQHLNQCWMGVRFRSEKWACYCSICIELSMSGCIGSIEQLVSVRSTGRKGSKRYMCVCRLVKRNTAICSIFALPPQTAQLCLRSCRKGICTGCEGTKKRRYLYSIGRSKTLDLLLG